MDSKKPTRAGAWEQLEVLTDPDSGMSVIISKRIRGREDYSIQLVHLDEMGANKHIQCPLPKAKHNIEDIAFSLCKSAREYIEKHKRESSK